MKKIWIVAGEASGDSRASEVMREILKREPSLIFQGAGGPQMAALSTPPFDNWIEKAGVIGIWDVLKLYPWFLRKFNEMLRQIADVQPSVLLLVDYPGFNLRLAKTARERFPHLKIIYYVSPQVWAWNRGRIPKMAKILDLMLCIFPFEKSLYECSGLKTEFVGHPLVEKLETERSNMTRDPNLLGLFPGSRWKEVRRILPVMMDAASLILRQRPTTRFEIAAANKSHANWMHSKILNSTLPITLSTGTAHTLMQRACAGIVCSGTATLEAACFELPYCLIYKTAWLTFEIGRRLVTIPFLGIINILADKALVKEFIQHFATPQALTTESLRLLNSPQDRQELILGLRSAITSLGGHGAACQAADAILQALQ